VRGKRQFLAAADDLDESRTSCASAIFYFHLR
jgi:hypothetical protein